MVRVTRSKVKVKIKVTEVTVRKLRKWPISNSISSAGMHVIKPVMLDYDTPRQLSEFCPDRLLKFVLVRPHVTYKVCEESIGSPVWDLFIFQ